MRPALPALAVLLFACTSNSSDVPETILGTWTLEIDDGYQCFYAYALLEDEWEFDYICALKSGKFGIQAEVGTYTTTDDTEITFRRTHSSCPDDIANTSTFTYELQDHGNVLQFVNSKGVLHFVRAPDDDGSGNPSGGVAVYGCYDTDRSFVAHEIAEIK